MEDKSNIKRIKLDIELDDLNSFDENKKKIIFLYLQFSILKLNSIKTFFAFLNPKKCETFLISQFTLFYIEDLYDFKRLLNSLKSTIKNEIIRNG